MKYIVSKTYDVVTPESAAEGDVAEAGFEFEAREMDLEEVMDELDRLGSYENLQDAPVDQSLYGNQENTDYKTGEVTTYALHISGDEEAMQLFVDVAQGRKKMPSEEDEIEEAKESLDDRAKKLIAGFEKAVGIEKAVSGEVSEKEIDGTEWRYGGREVSASTPDGLLFIWDVNSIGDRHSYMLFDIQDENGKSISEAKEPESTHAEFDDKNKYRFYVVDKSSDEIESGWEYRQDAMDAAKEMKEDGMDVKVLSAKAVSKEMKEKFHRPNKIMSKMESTDLAVTVNGKSYGYVVESAVMVQETKKPAEDLYVVRRELVGLAKEVASKISDMKLPDPDSVAYERSPSDYEKDVAAAKKKMKAIEMALKSLNESREKNLTEAWLPRTLKPEHQDLVSEVSNKLKYEIDAAMAFAVALLEDVNAHEEAAKVNAALTEVEEQIKLGEAAVRIVNQDAAIECLEYILTHEKDDYFEWCESEGLDCSNVNNPHIYASASRAFGDAAIEEQIKLGEAKTSEWIVSKELGDGRIQFVTRVRAATSVEAEMKALEQNPKLKGHKLHVSIVSSSELKESEEDEMKQLDKMQAELQALYKSDKPEDAEKAKELQPKVDALFKKLYSIERIRSVKKLGEEASEEEIGKLANDLALALNADNQSDEEALKELRQEISDTLDMEKGRYSSWGDAGSFEVDGQEYSVIGSEDEAERIATDMVKDQLESEPELFSQDFLSEHLYVTETDQRLIANEEADAYVDGMDDEDLVKMAEMEDEYESAEDKEEVVSRARDAVIEKRYEEVKEMLKRDPIGYLVDELGAYTREEAMKLPFIGIDTEAAAEEAVRLDGWAHFLSLYDGNYETTPAGAVYFKE